MFPVAGDWCVVAIPSAVEWGVVAIPARVDWGVVAVSASIDWSIVAIPAGEDRGVVTVATHCDGVERNWWCEKGYILADRGLLVFDRAFLI